MIKAFELRLEYFIYQIQRIYRLQQFVFLTGVDLPYIGLRSIEQYPLAKLRRPDHLHLDDKLTSFCIAAADVHDTVLA